MSKIQKIQKRRGQGMTEYVIIVALIAIAAIAVITVFGQNIRSVFADSANSLGGAQTAKNSGTTGNAVSKNKNLSDFNDNKAK